MMGLGAGYRVLVMVKALLLLHALYGLSERALEAARGERILQRTASQPHAENR